MEETRRIRMKQRADKWKEQVTVYIIIKFLLKKCLRGTGLYFLFGGISLTYDHWQPVMSLVSYLVLQAERAERWRREPQKVNFILP